MTASTSEHAVTARFDADLLHVLTRTFPFEGALCIDTTGDDLTIGSVNHANVLGVSVTIPTDTLEAYHNTTPGRSLIHPTAADGLLSILNSVDGKHDTTFELDIGPDHVGFHHCDSTRGGEAPRERIAVSPVDPDTFDADLDCQTTITAPAAVEPLYLDAGCPNQNAHAELAAVDGEASLTMSGTTSKRADLGDATHPEPGPVTALYDADYVHTVFDALAWRNDETTLRWGDDLPLVLDMPSDDYQFQAAVAPRVGESLEDDPLHQSADQLKSVAAAVAGGF
mgnify:CR=1 FL=1